MSKNPLGLPGHLGNSLGDYLREQRLTKRLSVRQLSALAGISNPYLSQIERGVKRPSADILQQIAKGLSISAETLYVQAGLLDPQETPPAVGEATRAAIIADPALTLRQRQTLLDIYSSFVEDGTETAPAQKTAAKKAPAKKAPAKKTAAKKAPAKKAAAKKATSTKTTAATQTSAASKKGSSSTSSKNTSASRAARGTTTSSSTSTPRRNA